jgi:heat-inducible transcriptional repressor
MPGISNIELNDREKAILRTIIQLYILKASPIGSNLLSKYIENELKLSSATIRNIMSELESLELISHPHTSAGRIPTDKGYRFYVDSLMNYEKLSETEIRTVEESLKGPVSPVVLRDASKILGMLSKYLSIVEIPNLKEFIVEKIELISLSSSRLLVIIALDSKDVKMVTLEAEFEIEQINLTDINTYINEKVSGRRLRFIKENFKELISDSGYKDMPLIRLFVESVDKIFQYRPQDEKLFIAGAQNLLQHPEFENVDKVKSIVEIIENEDIIIHLLDSYEGANAGINILIGSEINNETMADYSLIVSSYQIGSGKGSIGLIGPKRMNYSKMISLLQHVSNVLSN